MPALPRLPGSSRSAARPAGGPATWDYGRHFPRPGSPWFSPQTLPHPEVPARAARPSSASTPARARAGALRGSSRAGRDGSSINTTTTRATTATPALRCRQSTDRSPNDLVVAAHRSDTTIYKASGDSPVKPARSAKTISRPWARVFIAPAVKVRRAAREAPRRTGRAAATSTPRAWRRDSPSPTCRLTVTAPSSPMVVSAVVEPVDLVSAVGDSEPRIITAHDGLSGQCLHEAAGATHRPIGRHRHRARREHERRADRPTGREAGMGR